MQTNIHALSGIRTHDPSVRAGEDISCISPCGHCDRHVYIKTLKHVTVYSLVLAIVDEVRIGN
jgi:hypothetical protein